MLLVVADDNVGATDVVGVAGIVICVIVSVVGGGVIAGVTKPLFQYIQPYIVVIVIVALADNDGVCLNYLSRLRYLPLNEY